MYFVQISLLSLGAVYQLDQDLVCNVFLITVNLYWYSWLIVKNEFCIVLHLAKMNS